jgi:1-acyl-sn-glycerol-3-phosphate acyltransferase
VKKRNRLVKPFDWSLRSPIRGLRGDLQELVLFPILRLFARMKIEKSDVVEKARGPFVIVSNHTSHFDAPVILAALPYRIRHRTIVAAAADYFYKFAPLGALTSLALGTIPFERHEGSRESLDRCKEGIRRGWSVLIFPEGTRSRSGEMREFKPGAAYLCVDTRCAALPVHLEGLRDVMPKGKWLPRRGRVSVKFGEPLGPHPDDDYRSFTTRIHDAVEQLG